MSTTTTRSRRATLAEIALRMRADGSLLREIATELGISNSYAADIVNDPTGERMRARKDSYRGTCIACGEPTDGSNGRGRAPQTCLACTRLLLHEGRFWTRERILESLAQFVADYGYAPSCGDWSRAHAARLARTSGNPHAAKPGHWPDPGTVQREFGSWQAMIDAAGLASRRHHHRSLGPNYGHFRQVWTRELILAAIQSWAAEHGRPPTTRDWRRCGDQHPNNVTVYNRFGSWGAALLACGFAPNRSGRRAKVAA